MSPGENKCNLVWKRELPEAWNWWKYVWSFCSQGTVYLTSYYLCHWDYVLFGVCLSVCLFGCNLTTTHKNCRLNLHESFTREVSVDKGELIKFWKSSASVSGSRKFVKHSSTLHYTAFLPQFGSYLGKSWLHLCKKNFVRDELLDKEVPVTFWKYMDPESSW